MKETSSTLATLDSVKFTEFDGYLFGQGKVMKATGNWARIPAAAGTPRVSTSRCGHPTRKRSVS